MVGVEAFDGNKPINYLKSLIFGLIINYLLQHWRKGTPLTTGILKKWGYSPQLLNRYKQSGWIESIGQGAYKLKGQEVQWTGALYTLQTYLKQPLHVGGITALEWSVLSSCTVWGNKICRSGLDT